MLSSFAQTLALALLTATSLAQPVNHHVHKRDPAEVFVTVQQTYYVTAGDEAIPTSTAAAVSAIETTSAAAAVETTSSAATVETSSTAAAVSTSSSAAASASSSSSSSSSSESESGSAGAKGITYSPYTSSGGCKTSAEVSEDLAKLTGYDVIRLYGTDCNQVGNVKSALASGQKLFLGVFDVGDISTSLSSIKSQLDSDWSCVDTISIGNENVNDGTASVSQVSGWVSTAKSILKGYGYTGSVTHVDTFIAIINNPGLCDVGDYITMNAHAFFDGGIAAADAGSWAAQQITRVNSACGGDKTIVITESGWPSQGETNGVAVPSSENQQAAIASLKTHVGSSCFLFTAFNDLWKSPGSYDAEQHWGIYGDASA